MTRVLSLHQPWASLVVRDVKSVETRSWSTQYRGPIAIHASAVFSKQHREFFGNGTKNLLAARADELPLGAIIGLVTLYDVRSTDEIVTRMTTPWGKDGWHEEYAEANLGDVLGSSDSEGGLGDFGPGRFAWLLHKAFALPEPIPFKGGLGLRVLPDDVDQKIAEQLSLVAS